MSETRFQALRSRKDALGRLDFFGNDEPKCPHCEHEVSVSDNELWRLYEEGEHEIECPSCGQEFTVSTTVKYSFSTDSQDEGT